jgi:uncharacterized protein
MPTPKKKTSVHRTAGPTALTRVRRLPKRGAYDLATLCAILDAAVYCHVAHVIDGQPVCTPTLHWRHGERVYWHGSVASRMLKGTPGRRVCLTATLVDGFVLARSGFNHSMNYRAVMCFGEPEVVTAADAKSQALEHFMEHWLPGRWARLRPPTRKELNATTVLSMPIDIASAKIRTGGPHDPEADVAWPVWAGVIPLQLRPGAPQASEDYRGAEPAPRLADPATGRAT